MGTIFTFMVVMATLFPHLGMENRQGAESADLAQLSPSDLINKKVTYQLIENCILM